MLHADDLVLMSEMIKGPRTKLLKWKEAFESKRLKVKNVKRILEWQYSRKKSCDKVEIG